MRLGLAEVLAGMTQVGASAARQYLPTVPAPAPPPAVRPSIPSQAPAYLRNRIAALGCQFNGRVGIAVKSVNEGWWTGWKADELYPQPSVSKLWVSITAFDAVDKGKVNLNQRVTLTRSDLTLFHQPIAARVLGGGATMSVNQLMYEATTKSDNTANDKPMRSGEVGR